MKRFSLILFWFVIFCVNSTAQFNVDSLESIWKNKSNNVDQRMSAALKLIIHKYSKIDLDLAQQTANELLFLAEKSDNSSYKIMALRSLGIIDNYWGKYESSLDFYEQALTTARVSENKKLEAQVLTNMGTHFGEVKMLSLSMNYFNNAIKLFDEISYDRGKALIFDNIGLIYIELENFEKAEHFIRKALDITKKYNPNKKSTSLLRIETYCYNNLSLIYKKTGKYSEAQSFCEESIELSVFAKDSFQLSKGYSDLCEINFLMEKLDEAQINAKKSIKLCKRTRNLQTICNPMIVLSKVFLKEAKHKKAIQILNDAYRYAETINSLEQKKEICYQRYNTYKSFKEKDNAISEYELYIKLNDSINIDNSSKDVLLNEIKKKFIGQARKDSMFYSSKIQKIEAESIISKKETKATKKQFYVLSFVFLIVLIFASFLYKQRNTIFKQKLVVDKAHRAIQDSIEYSERIQRAVSPSDKKIKQVFPHYFLFFQPKDIVSGDFYCVHTFGDSKLIVVGDCTGHGVPGAYMTIMAINILTRIIDEGVSSPSEIILQMDKRLYNSLRHNNEEIRDGMDLSICLINKESVVFSATHQSLYFVSNNQIAQYKGDNVFLGEGKAIEIKSCTIKYKEKDQMYLPTDGFSDQKGHLEMKKYYSKRFKKLLLENSELPFYEQQKNLEKVFNNWKGSLNQVDDVTVFGIQL